MEKTNYLIYGGGTHSRVVISILEKMGIQIAGIFDINNRLKKIKKIPFLGHYDAQINSNSKLVIAVGDNDVRKKISEVVQHPIGTIIDPDAIISEEVFISFSIGRSSLILSIEFLIFFQIFFVT